MTPAVRLQILLVLVERLRGHAEHVGRTPGIERALTEAENALREIEQQKEQPR
jgi:hypothetical protein